MRVTGVTDVIIVSNNEVTNQKDNQLSSCKHAPHSTILDYYAYFCLWPYFLTNELIYPDPVILANKIANALMIPWIIKRTCMYYKYTRE